MIYLLNFTRKKIFLVTLSFLLIIVIFMLLFSPQNAPATELKLKVPEIQSDHWINSTPLDWEKLRGKVTMVEFWTFGCYNCKNVEPYIKQWYKKYQNQGFEIVAIHSPEFDHERNIDNVKQYTAKKSITYPVAIDNDFANWKRFTNRYWPAMYLVDKKGYIRYRFIGEGRYALIEEKIQQLLSEPG